MTLDVPLPWYETNAGRAAALVLLLVLTALALFVYNLGALEELAPLAPARVGELERLQWLFAGGAVSLGGLILRLRLPVLGENAQRHTGHQHQFQTIRFHSHIPSTVKLACL